MEKNKERIYELLESMLGKRRFRTIFFLVLYLLDVPKTRIIKDHKYGYTTVNKYIAAINTGAVESLFEDNVYRQVSELEPYRKQIEEDFEKKPPKTLQEAQTRIEKMTGIRRSRFRIGEFLKKGA